MRFRLKIFIPNNVLYKEIDIEAENVYEAKQISNVIFNREFEASGKRNGNFVIEPYN